MKPLCVVNFKCYPAGTGTRALQLAMQLDGIARETNAPIAVAVQAADIFRIASAVKIPVFAQYVDPIGYGPHTGKILPEAIKDAGAVGTLLNHAERRMAMPDVKIAIKKCHELGLQTVVCTDFLEEAKEIARFQPTYAAFEEPSLIGKLQSISRMHPEGIRAFVRVLAGTGVTPLCGAGIATGEDVKEAFELGTAGVLVAAAIVNAPSPEQIAQELAQAFGWWMRDKE